ncbi:MAG TPA: hypothetical protein VNP03_06280 [Pseudonocardia sp.]|nr:hypothetical protein [Pseudonocardia sp.]
MDVTRKFGNRVLDVLDLDEPLTAARPSADRPVVAEFNHSGRRGVINSRWG